MRIEDKKTGHATLVSVEGRLDASTWQLFHDHLMKLFGSGEKNFVLDCSGINYISSLGIRALLLIARKANEVSGKVVLCAIPQDVQKIFDISGIMTLFPITSTREEALEKL